ncbi:MULTISPECIES: 7-carboxy-7-deazaguanine synthase QueE [unclassified Methylophaga]|jgi:7-carboxy-7-deazaguanine synthase|uniref:7-carboxy-7-deazaguanine synthase QueE n=1 Tax=unclassified Methylophaga TaxID=2629249 RepID=UPI000C5203B9|nr:MULTISPECIES: 7-carboxy-7-deazaguanine synthase QueE [unclassified Methylophaga]MAL49158.1 7-carboxy-7-deazaguanine synthase QueE [Methylophaga sp.]MBP25452.1 7-carboxy-7-deazaguanine synthase QueE [Methylophaga sp.]HAO26337.1 7-carboxy-7-deazaguanine synthase QueE [Methylophaga sp.]HCC82097.1 7-carboxy-7-deazaguanine synthase QueE [Methylophaga sp.]|tara:strand:- start:804 stop:1445 length:642 start_codon:yes stop_codon:yes gene_type:complete
MAQCRITEIFYSLQGETRTVGLPTVFVRLTGCPLRCGYCDTAYAFHGGQKMEISDIVAEVKSYNPRYVTVTGGEPLAQNTCRELLTALCELDVEVSLETSGAMDISNIDPRVVRVMDLKTPTSGEVSKNRYGNIDLLNPQDQIKFVICNREDYDWAREQLFSLELIDRCEILFSPVHGDLNPTDLAEWIIADNLPVRMQIQLHKYLWNDAQGR